MKIKLEKETLTDDSTVYNCHLTDDNDNTITIDLASREKGSMEFVDKLQKLLTEHAAVYPIVPEIEYVDC